MKRHGSMNRIYRLVWSQVLDAWVAVAENTRGRGKSISGRKLIAAFLALIASPFLSPLAQASPSGGQVVAGSGSISQAGATTTITQASSNLSLNWQSFNVTAKETVNFQQPSAAAIAVNRIFDTNGTQVLGHLNANGQVYLINPNGILFGQGSQINVGGLVASTLELNAASLGGNTRIFGGNGTGSVINQGNIAAGYVALLGNKVSNQGTIVAQLGTVALGAGSAATLTFSGNNLVKMQIDQSTLNNLAENGGLIKADGGMVVMTAGARDALLASVVNNTGVIEARTVENHNGTITLLGGMAAGTVNVGGTLDASALPLLPSPLPISSQGGGIETSAAHVNVANDAKVTTAASSGLSGTWLIDPVDFNIAASGGNITGAALSTSLGGGNVTILSSSGTTGTSGDVNVNDTVTWSVNALTLSAQNNININTAMNGSGTASLALQYGQGALAAGNTSSYNINAPVNLASGNHFSTKLGSDGATVNYTVITSLGAQGSITANDLQGMSGNLAGNYALGGNIDAGATSTWNANAGFMPVGDSTANFTGSFDGLGHTIANLTVSLPATNYVGLFGRTDASAAIRNVGMTGGSISGHNGAGGLVGVNSGTISNSYATDNVSGTIDVGGLAGQNTGSISASHATGTVMGSGSGFSGVGGLVGHNNGSISNSYATGAVTSQNDVGGLVGHNYGGTISGSYATGAVAGNTYVGGMVGYNTGNVSNSHASGSVSGASHIGGLLGGSSYGSTVSNSYATGSVSGTGSDIGGLMGSNYGNTISNSYATGSVSGANNVGGLLGSNYGSTINNSYATGNVSGTGDIGGLVGFNYGGTVSNTYATGSVSGTTNVGGLIGRNTGTVSNGYWDTQTSGQATSAGGTGLTTAQMMTTSNFTGFNFTTTPGAAGNNWVIVDANGTLNNSGGATGAAYPMLASEYSTNINNAHQLQLTAMNLGASYTLGANIDALNTGNGKDIWGSGGFIPLGNSTTNFTGTFDGMNHTVSNLTINRPTQNDIGLFGATGAGSTISNVGLLGGSISGNNTVGGLVGSNYGSTISNSYVTGNVSGNSDIGGLIGASYGSTISNGHATGNVTGTGSDIGGLVGYNFSAISSSYSTGSVSGASYIGGLVGHNYGAISNSHVTGNVTGTGSDIGGLVGYNFGAISSSYATGSVSGTGSDIGGLVGLNRGTLSNAFYNVDAVTINSVHQLTAGGLYNTQYIDWFNHNETLNIANYSSTLPSGSGSYYNVSSVQGLKDMLGFSESNASLSFRLTANIDLTGNPGFYIPYFAGNFDGGNNTISNLSINGTNSVIGMFGILPASSSSVSNLGLVNANVSGTNGIGGLVGINLGTVSNSYATGSVSGVSHVGGLLGSNYGGTVSNSHATDSVSGTGSDIGGLSGSNYGNTISNSYATGSVSGDSNVGGLVGSNYGSTISNSYATGSVSGASYVGGLVGNNGGTINNSYARGNVTGTSSANIDNFGGLVGFNSGSVINSYATGNVTGGGGNFEVGGLVGDNHGTIDNSYATGSVSGPSDIGGLVGANIGTISNSYSTGSASGTVDVGGLVGWNDNLFFGSGTVSNTYATGSVSGTTNVGGLVGRNTGTVSNGYWDTQTSGQTTSAGGTGLTTAQMMNSSNFTGFNFTTTPGAAGNNWVIVDADGTLNNAAGAAGATYPMLASEYSANIFNAHQLQLTAMNLAGAYTLGANIDALNTGNGMDIWGSGGFIPLGNSTTNFTGTFDGMNHTVSNLTIDRPTQNDVGLFGAAGADSVVQNVGLLGSNVRGNYFVGALIGWNAGVVGNSYYTGSVNGVRYVGGLVGFTFGTPLLPPVQNVMAQLESNILSFQFNHSPGTLNLSPTVNQTSGAGGAGGPGRPALHIVNGGIRLPDNMFNIIDERGQQ